jgi:membrane glycosyltransferase
MVDATPALSRAPIARLPRRDRADGLTPAGLQRVATLAARRRLVFALVTLTLAALGAGVAVVLAGGGWSVADTVIFLGFLLGAPWTVLGLWNAALGLWVLHGPERLGGGRAAAPPLVDEDVAETPLIGRVAVLMCLRNEDPDRAFRRLLAMRGGLDATGEGRRFDFFALSDSDIPEIVAREKALFAQHAAALGPGARYRVRESNEGWKAGNLRDFLRRWGSDYTLFLPLDSDSLMEGETILRMARLMERHPRIGILQSLVVGAPSDSLFARLFQFGMRHGMRSYTAGAVWWSGDASAYWGHNAMIRTAPFKAKCRLPVLPGEPPLGGHILSHDQIEAALMRRAGYECRILPVETGSFEENPPTFLDFIKRDHRWCNGNMQYWGLTGLRGLAPMSRFQIVAAMMMYFGGPAWMAMTLAAASMILTGQGFGADVAFGIAMFLIMFSVSLAPKVAGWIDVALTPGGMRAYGGRLRFAAGALAETVFSVLMAPAAALAVTVFMAGLPFGRTIQWSGQKRDLTAVSWGEAARIMWPQTAARALALTAAVALGAPARCPGRRRCCWGCRWRSRSPC